MRSWCATCASTTWSGFQTDEDLEGFNSAVRAVFREEASFGEQRVDLNGRDIGTGVFPIGVDVDVIARQAEEAVRDDDEVKRLAQGLLGRKLLLGVDRLDYSKGLVERFTSYRALLESSPELQGKDHIHPDRAAEPDQCRGLRRYPGPAGAGRGPHQRSILRYRLDAGALSQQGFCAQDAQRISAHRQCRRRDPGARRHESGRQGVHRGTEPGGSRYAGAVEPGRCGPANSVVHCW